MAKDFDFQPEHDGTLSVESAVYQALGAASVCWDSMDGTGVFHSEQAKEIGERLLLFIKELSGLAGHEAQTWPR